MPLRSPKMYFCIFGFHRLVWWPKCTPASSSSFIVSVAMPPPSVCLRRAFVGSPRTAGTRSQARLAYGCGSHCGPARSKGPHYHRKRAACVMVGLRRVFGVDAHVLLAQVAGPDAVLAAAETQVDRDLVLPAPHDLPDALQAHALAQQAALDDPLAAEGDGHLVLLDPRRGLAEGHHDPPPVRVGAVERGLDERRIRDAPGSAQRVAPARRPSHGDRDELRRALAVRDQRPREPLHQRLEAGGKLREPPPPLE